MISVIVGLWAHRSSSSSGVRDWLASTRPSSRAWAAAAQHLGLERVSHQTDEARQKYLRRELGLATTGVVTDLQTYIMVSSPNAVEYWKSPGSAGSGGSNQLPNDWSAFGQIVNQWTAPTPQSAQRELRTKKPSRQKVLSDPLRVRFSGDLSS